MCWWIGFPRWSISYLARRLLTRWEWLSYISMKSTNFMGCLNPLFRIETLLFWGTFGVACGSWRTRSWISVVSIIPTDGQSEVVNRSCNLLHNLVEDHVKMWDQDLSQVEFAFNHSVNRNTGLCPFQIVYGIIPRAPIDLAPVWDLKLIHGKAEDII